MVHTFLLLSAAWTKGRSTSKSFQIEDYAPARLPLLNHPLPTRSFLEFVMFSRMFVDALDAQMYDEYHKSDRCYLSFSKVTFCNFIRSSKSRLVRDRPLGLIIPSPIRLLTA